MRDHLALLADNAGNLEAGCLSGGERDARLAQELGHAGLYIGQSRGTGAKQLVQVHGSGFGGCRWLAGWLTGWMASWQGEAAPPHTPNTGSWNWIKQTSKSPVRLITK